MLQRHIWLKASSYMVNYLRYSSLGTSDFEKIDNFDVWQDNFKVQENSKICL